MEEFPFVDFPVTILQRDENELIIGLQKMAPTCHSFYNEKRVVDIHDDLVKYPSYPNSE
jgi:hypothetical protein